MSTATPTLPPPAGPSPARRPAAPQGPISAPSAFAAIDPLKLIRQYYPWLIGSGILGVALGLGSYFALIYAWPIWAAEVTYEVRHVAQDPRQPLEGGGGSGYRDDLEAYMNTMVRVLRSDTILGRALRERAVQDTRWAQRFKDPSGNLNTVEALKKMRKIVSARAIADTNIIQLRVGTRHRDDAPNIANAISDVFLDDTGNRSGREMRDLIEQFEGVVRDLSRDLESLDQRAETLLSREQLTSLRQESTVQYAEVQNLQPALVKLLEDSARAGQQLQTYRELLNNPSGPQIPEAIREEVERKPIVMERDATIASIRALIRAQRERFGPRHLSVRQFENRLAAEEIERQNIVESQMRETFGAVVENLDNSVRNLDAAIEDTRRRLAEAERRLRDSTRALKQHDDMASEREGKLLKKAEMEKAVSDLRLLLARGTRIRVLARAQIPDELAFPRIIPMTAIGVVLVVGLTAGVITLREIREQRVRGPADVALIPRTRVLGVIPDISLDPGAPERAECAIIERPHGAISESIRQLRTALCKELVTKNYKTVLVLSGMPGSGTSSLLSNLAINAGATDMRVLIVDANLRRPKMHEIFKTHDRPGFADVLLGEATLDRAIVQTGIRNVSVLPCGRRDVPVFERYTTPAMAEIFKSLRERYDLVLIDTTPGVVAGDGVALAAHCDACFMVARAYSEKRGLIARLRNQLTETGVEFLGVVVNAVKPSAGGYMKRNIQVTHEYGREGAAEMPPHADQQKKNSDDKPAS